MAVTQRQINRAKVIQDAAAHDLNQTVRLVAGPGSGKSYAIEERVTWLYLEQNIDLQSIIAISFTRASSKDLRNRIYEKGHELGINNIERVRVSTLHSLALYILRRSGNLNQFPTDPTILDNWELANIFDVEFSNEIGITPTRSNEIRQDHEAYWSTGNWNPPNLPIFKVPITQEERDSFNAFYITRTQVYSCVLPGEVIRTCVLAIDQGHIDPVAELGVTHLIVDEVQDLNPCDFQFIDLLIQRGVNVFVSGDDDQSIYSFRYAFPQGIQDFNRTYPQSTNHVLNDCFRCTTNILDAALRVLNSFPDPKRIPKNLSSVYVNSDPPNPGVIFGKRVINPREELEFIANTCSALIENGIEADDIMILIGNKRTLLNPIIQILEAREIPFDANMRDSFKDAEYGQFLLGLLRVLLDENDYIAHRTILGTPRGIGIDTIASIIRKVILNYLNFRNLFSRPLPPTVFSNRESNAIEKAVQNLNSIDDWQIDDTLEDRLQEINTILLRSFNQHAIDHWQGLLEQIPPEIRLDELKEYLQTDSELSKEKILSRIEKRINPVAEQELELPKKIKVTSFHSSKGLSSKIVLIPGLEEFVFPTERSRQSPGLILENARLFYVAVTRAQAACIMSYSENRMLQGRYSRMTASRFCQATGVHFDRPINNSIDDRELLEINTSVSHL